MSRMILRCLPCGWMMLSFSDAENTRREANLSVRKEVINLRYFETSSLGNVKKIVVCVGLELR